MNQKNLLEVDWSKIPAPADDGAAAHLVGMTIPPVSLLATDDNSGDAVGACPAAPSCSPIPAPASPARSAWSTTGT